MPLPADSLPMAVRGSDVRVIHSVLSNSFSAILRAAVWPPTATNASPLSVSDHLCGDRLQPFEPRRPHTKAWFYFGRWFWLSRWQSESFLPAAEETPRASAADMPRRLIRHAAPPDQPKRPPDMLFWCDA